MEKLCLVLLLNTLVINLNAQAFQWAKREGLWGYDYGYAVGTDNAGNVYVAGKYEMNANFSDTILANQGNHDIYLARYSPDGNLDWIRTGGGSLGDYAVALTTDGTSSVIIAGEIEGVNGPILFSESAITITAVGGNDAFVAKYRLNGSLLWAKSEGGWNNEKALGVTNDKSGNIYVCGFFTDTTIFNGVTIPGAGLHDTFLAKYDDHGNFQWMQKGGGPGRDEALSTKCDAAGNIYVCGFFSDSAVFGGTMYYTVSTINDFFVDAYVAKYSPNGTLLWFKQSGGDYDDVAWSITTDDSDKAYVTGAFNANASFDSIDLSSSGNSDVFVASFNGSGDVVWAVKAGGALIDRAKAIYSDGYNLYITGHFGDTAAFGITSLTAVDNSDIFISCLNNSGDFLWSISVGGQKDSLETLGHESGDALAVDNSGNVYATGALLNGGIFGSDDYSPYSRTDMFIAKISQQNVGLNEKHPEEEFKIYPNPSKGDFTLELAKPAIKSSIVVTNEIGQSTITKSIENKSFINFDISGESKGLYFIEIIVDEKIYHKKIISIN